MTLLMAQEYLAWAEGPETADHAEWCEYRQRKPALEADCDCGTFHHWTWEANDAADRLARAVIGENDAR